MYIHTINDNLYSLKSVNGFVSVAELPAKHVRRGGNKGINTAMDFLMGS